jgi:hypothetical protein
MDPAKSRSAADIFHRLPPPGQRARVRSPALRLAVDTASVGLRAVRPRQLSLVHPCERSATCQPTNGIGRGGYRFPHDLRKAIGRSLRLDYERRPRLYSAAGGADATEAVHASTGPQEDRTAAASKGRATAKAIQAMLEHGPHIPDRPAGGTPYYPPLRGSVSAIARSAAGRSAARKSAIE